MAEITAASVKELRERTGAGMMDCKKALAENNGDMEAAVDWLRAKGLAAAAKKAGRTAAEGLVGVAVEGTKGAVVEVNSETDFVAKNEQFQDFVRKVAQAGARCRRRCRGAEGRRLSGRRHGRGEADRQYRHDRREPVAAPHRGARSQRGRGRSATSTMPLRPAWARSACWSRWKARLRPRRCRRWASRSRCTSPPPTRWRSTPTASTPSLLERERAIAIEKANESGKPANIVEKMVEGTMAKFRKENALLSQLFVMDNKTPVADVIAAAGKEAGSPITLKAFERFQLGEGIEKAESDFAAEVAAAAGVKKDEPVA